MHYVYVLKRDGKWYIGYTGDLRRRLTEHKKRYKCYLVYYEAYPIESLARKRETRLKFYGSAWRGLRNRIEGGV